MQRKLGLTLVLTAVVWAALLLSKVMHDHAPFWAWSITNIVICSLVLVMLLLLAKRATKKAEARQLVASATAPVEEMPGPNDEYCWTHEGFGMGGWYCEHPDCRRSEAGED